MFSLQQNFVLSITILFYWKSPCTVVNASFFVPSFSSKCCNSLSSLNLDSRNRNSVTASKRLTKLLPRVLCNEKAHKRQQNYSALQAHYNPLLLAKSTLSSLQISGQNIVLVTSSIAILLGYHFNLARKESNNHNSGTRSTTKTWRQYQADAREDWAKHVKDTEGWLYAIQSLRNAITAQTFLASTVLSLVTLITGRIWDILRSTTNQLEKNLLRVQLLSIATTMLISSYYFLQGVRLMTHAGFMFPIEINSVKVDKIMRKTASCQWLGLRWMYISLAPITWTVGGSRALFVAAIILLQFFRSIDREPEGLGDEKL